MNKLNRVLSRNNDEGTRSRVTRIAVLSAALLLPIAGIQADPGVPQGVLNEGAGLLSQATGVDASVDRQVQVSLPDDVSGLSAVELESALQQLQTSLDALEQLGVDVQVDLQHEDEPSATPLFVGQAGQTTGAANQPDQVEGMEALEAFGGLQGLVSTLEAAEADLDRLEMQLEGLGEGGIPNIEIFEDAEGRHISLPGIQVLQGADGSTQVDLGEGALTVEEAVEIAEDGTTVRVQRVNIGGQQLLVREVVVDEVAQ